MIIADDREVTQHPEIPEALASLGVEVARLDAGDFAFLGRSGLVGIERAEIGNFIQKLRSGELEEQLYKCQAVYQSIILLIEGVYDKVDSLLAIYKSGNRGYYRSHVYPHTLYNYAGGSLVRLSDYGIETLWSPNFQCSLEIVKTIYDQRAKPLEDSSLFRKVRVVRLPTKLTSNPAVPKLMGLCPRMNEKVAIRLINRYDNIWNILHAEDSDLLGVEGFGRGLLAKLKEGIGKA